MADRFVVDVRALDALARSYANAEAVIAEEVERAVKRAILAVEALAKKYVPTDTHHLQRSITSEARPLAGSLWRGVAGTNVPYAEAVERGQDPGRWPAKGELLGWMRRKGIEASAEFAIRRAIYRRGTKAQPYLERAFAELKPQIDAELAAIPARVVQRLGARA